MTYGETIALANGTGDSHLRYPGTHSMTGYASLASRLPRVCTHAVRRQIAALRTVNGERSS